VAKEGASVVLVGRTLERLQEAAEVIAATGASVRHVQGDVAERATADHAVQEALEGFGRIDVQNQVNVINPAARIPAVERRVTAEYMF